MAALVKDCQHGLRRASSSAWPVRRPLGAARKQRPQPLGPECLLRH